MEYTTITQRVEAKTKEIKVALYTALVAAVLADDGLKVVEFAQQLEELSDLQDIESLVGLIIEHNIQAENIEEFVKSYLYSGDYDDFFLELKKLEGDDYDDDCDRYI